MKKVICFVLTAVFCIGFITVPQVDASVPMQADLLYTLGIMEKPTDETAAVTRAEMVKRALALVQIAPQPEETETGFNDVASTHPYAVYVKTARDMGMIASAQSFAPDRTVTLQEALKMMAFALGYDGDALNSAQAVNKVASAGGLYAKLSVTGGSGLNEKNAMQLLLNTLQAPLNGVVLTTQNGASRIEMVKAGSGETLLTRVFGLAQYSVYFEEKAAEDGSSKLTVLQVKGKYEQKPPLSAGQTVNVTLHSALGTRDLQYVTASVWMDADRLVYSIETDSSMQIIYGMIDEVNQNNTVGALHDVRYITKLGISGEEDYIKTESDCRYYFNAAEVTKGGYAFVGAYARLVLENDRVVSLQAWTLAEGGIITDTDSMEITYTRGKIENLSLGNLGSYHDVTILLNGAIEEVYALQPDVFFDYWKSNDGETLLLVGSTRALSDDMTAYGADSIALGGEDYALSRQHPVYFADENGSYQAMAADLAGRLVTAYLDAGGYVRYVKCALPGVARQSFYGVITNYSQNGLHAAEAEVYALQSGGVQKGTYPFAKHLQLGDGLTLNDVYAELEKLYQNGIRNDALKQVKLLYRFKVNAKGEISKIENASLFDIHNNESYKNGISFYDFSTANYPYMPTPRVYFDGADICAVYCDDEGLQVKLLNWKDLSARSCPTAMRADFYSKEDSSDIELLLLRGDVQSLYYGREEYVRYGLITKKMTAYHEGRDKQQTQVELDGNTYFVTDEDAVKNVNRYAFVIYSESTSFAMQGSVSIVELYNLSGKPETWETVSGTTAGLHRSGITEWDSRRIYFADGNRLYIGTGMPVYKLIGEKIVKSSMGDLYEGADCWYIYHNSELRGLIFR